MPADGVMGGGGALYQILAWTQTAKFASVCANGFSNNPFKPIDWILSKLGGRSKRDYTF